MKRISTFVAFALASVSITGAGEWKRQVAVPWKFELNNVLFADSLNGWAWDITQGVMPEGGGGGGRSNTECVGWIRTNDGGTTWTDDWHGCPCSDAVFLGTSFGARLGNQGTVSYTTDLGRNWKSSGISIPSNLIAITFLDTLHGWVAGDSGLVFRTDDGGYNWTKQTTGTIDQMREITFIDTSHGWVIGGYLGNPPLRGVILRTNDGGRTWVTSEVREDYCVMDIAFANATRGWCIVGHYYKETHLFGTEIWESMDGGTTWITSSVGDSIVAKEIEIQPNGTGWICGTGLKYTFDYGEHWAVMTSADVDAHNVRDAYFIDPNWGWAVGEHGLILRFHK